ncbi:MAG: M28 family peptidase [Armatimonadetes bacterium]|nr:M28 family peptidase [Armatimonadota bacterium]
MELRDIRGIVERVDEERIRRGVFALAADPLPRRTLNFTLPGHDRSTLEEADDWIAARLADAGLKVERRPYPVQAYSCDRTKPLHHWYAAPEPGAPTYTAHNLIAEIPGTERPDEVIVLVAHKDSQSWIDCPGALDNAVGTVCLTEMARLLARAGLRRTVRFLFCNEEHTPWTSAHAANEWRERGDNLVAVYNVDSLGGKSDDDRRAGRATCATLITLDEGRPLAELMERMNRDLGIGLEHQIVQREFANDDDGSFVKAGYGAAVAVIGSFPYADEEYHMPGDTADRVDFANVRMAAQAVLACILSLAG